MLRTLSFQLLVHQPCSVTADVVLVQPADEEGYEYDQKEKVSIDYVIAYLLQLLPLEMLWKGMHRVVEESDRDRGDAQQANSLADEQCSLSPEPCEEGLIG